MQMFISIACDILEQIVSIFDPFAFQLTLKESIRYRSGDPVEAWLSALLCLEPSLPSLPTPLPSPEECQLFYVNRDSLFSYSQVLFTCF
jgi:tRNA(Met) C34 N-acetyltransferase TmcA